MSPFNVDALIVPTVAIFLCTLVVALRMTQGLALSISVAFIKATLFMWYFGVVFDGTYTFLDDQIYLQRGLLLLHRDVGITNLADNWNFVLEISESDHFAYYLYNAYALRLFGEGYFAPVTLNILLTLPIAQIGTRLATAEFGLGRRSARVLFVGLLLHPEILAWSTVVNGKDTLVLLSHVVLLVAIATYFRGQLTKALLIALPAVIVLLFLRFYVPLLFAVALVVSTMLAKGFRWRNVGYFLVSLLLLGAMVSYLGQARFTDAVAVLTSTFVNPAYGLVRAALTPIPFHTETASGFLDLPALFHWMLFPFAVAGVLRMWKLRTPFARFFVIYFLVFLGLYAVLGELQGPRHRVQLEYAWAMFQLLGVAAFLRAVCASVDDATDAPAVPRHLPHSIS